MAIENTYLLGTGITVAGGFDLQAKTPLDSRQTVPVLAGLDALIAGNACYDGMIVYVEENKTTYQYQCIAETDEGVKSYSFIEFGVNNNAPTLKFQYDAEHKRLIIKEENK